MKINLNNKFYKAAAVKEAIKAFSGVCGCKIISDSFEIELVPKNNIESDLAGEFSNFVLGITKDKNLF